MNADNSDSGCSTFGSDKSLEDLKSEASPAKLDFTCSASFDTKSTADTSKKCVCNDRLLKNDNVVDSDVDNIRVVVSSPHPRCAMTAASSSAGSPSFAAATATSSAASSRDASPVRLSRRTSSKRSAKTTSGANNSGDISSAMRKSFRDKLSLKNSSTTSSDTQSLSSQEFNAISSAIYVASPKIVHVGNAEEDASSCGCGSAASPMKNNSFSAMMKNCSAAASIIASSTPSPRKHPPTSASSATTNSAAVAVGLLKKVPGGVRSYFGRKKKSWPTLYGANDEHAESPNVCGERIRLTRINNNIDALVQQPSPLTPSINNCMNYGSIAAVAATAATPLATAVTRIRNLTSQNSALELGVASGGAVLKRLSVSRLPSSEDPGPSVCGMHRQALRSVGAHMDELNDDDDATARSLSTGAKVCGYGAKSPVFVLPLSYTLPPNGAKFKFVQEGQIQMCRLNHSRTVLGKLSSSKLLRRWETHLVVLGDDEITAKTTSGSIELSVKYALMEDVHCLPQWDSNVDKFCIRIFIPEGSILLQTNHAYTRNQWLYSIQWRRNLYRYRRIVELSSGRPEVLLKETKCLVEQVKSCPLQGDNLSLKAVVLISRLIYQIFAGSLPKTMLDPVIHCLAPLLDTVCTVTEVSPWLSRFCNDYPRSRLIDEVLSEVAQQTLKKTMDFGKYPTARIFVQDFLLAMHSQNNGRDKVKNFISNVHSLSSCCPHPRVLPNLVAVSLAAIHGTFDPSVFVGDEEKTTKLFTFTAILDIVSEFEDWRSPLSVLLQPIPFPDDVLVHATFVEGFCGAIRRLGLDARCDIHLSVLGVRETKEGWLHLVCPGGPVCPDDGELFSCILENLLHCCCRRKRFLQGLSGMLGPLQLLALRENGACMEALCHMLEFEVVEGEDLKLQMITALQSTQRGKRQYTALCDRQIALRELQQKGGPRKLTLPSKSTDSDLAVLLSSGSFGNLEWLSLAFTNVTSACADYLIRLPALRYLNLWSTQFGDAGLQLLAEHLSKLQVLNLCETPMTDKGLLSLAALKNLRKLNLNSTQLSAKTFLILKNELPALQEVDVRYTEAWCADDIIN